MTEEECLKIVVEALGGNPYNNLWTWESVVKSIIFNAKHYTGQEVIAAQARVQAVRDAQIVGLKAELRRQEQNYGRLAAKYQRLKAVLRVANNGNRMLMNKLKDYKQEKL